MKKHAFAILFAAAIASPSHARTVHDNDGRTYIGEHSPKRKATRHVKRARHVGRARSVSLGGVVPPLAVKAREIEVACGSRVVSSVRQTRIAGSRRLSLHASGRAVDLQGNPSCIYAHLKGWPGGVSTDYQTAPGGRHVHISYNPGGREWGLRFAHRHGVKRIRVAHRGG